MSIFGYRRKNFEENNTKFANQITEVIRLTKDAALSEALSNLRREIVQMPYPGNKYNDNLEKIDKQVFGAFEELKGNVQRGDIIGASIKVDQIKDAFEKSRRFGRECVADDTAQVQTAVDAYKKARTIAYEDVKVLSKKQNEIYERIELMTDDADKEAEITKYNDLDYEKEEKKGLVLYYNETLERYIKLQGGMRTADTKIAIEGHTVTPQEIAEKAARYAERENIRDEMRSESFSSIDDILQSRKTAVNSTLKGDDGLTPYQRRKVAESKAQAGETVYEEKTKTN